VTDGQTGGIGVAYTALGIASRGKNPYDTDNIGDIFVLVCFSVSLLCLNLLKHSAV